MWKSLDKTLICKKGGYVSMRHNTLRDTEALFLKQKHKDVKIEPELLPVEQQNLILGTNKAP